MKKPQPNYVLGTPKDEHKFWTQRRRKGGGSRINHLVNAFERFTLGRKAHSRRAGVKA